MEKKKILVICRSPENVAPSQRLKFEQYYNSWRENGYDIKISPFYSDRMQEVIYTKNNIPEKIYRTLRAYFRRFRELLTLNQYDVVYVFLWVTPFGSPIMEWLYVKRNPHIIYDIDDAVFMKVRSQSNWYVDFIRGRRKPFFLMKHAKHVIACTPFLTETASKYNKNVTDISSTINTDKYQPVNNYQNDHVPVLGWSGSRSTAKFMYLLKDVLIELSKHRKFKLLVMGDATFKIDGIDMEAVAWTPEREVPTLQRFDIGLYPLPINDGWVLGKSGLKALQYMAVGVPVIATAVGANFRIMEEGKTGFLVETDAQWIEKLILLIDNPELRRSVGLAGRKNVEENYSLHVNAPIYLNILSSASKQ